MVEHKVEGWLTDAYDYERPRRGQIRDGVIIKVEEQGITVDVGLKREGIVPVKDIDRLGGDALSGLEPGQEVKVYVSKPNDRHGNLILSLYRARLEKDWRRAQGLLESGQLCRGTVNGYNRGGVTVEFGRLNGFVPGSHLLRLAGRRFSADERKEAFPQYVGQEISLKVIEVERSRRRLILSERLAERQLRKERMKKLLDELLEGQVCEGTISRLCDFGAFVDLGGADGLVHISELSWRPVQHPREVVQEGDRVRVYVLRLDHDRRRIGLSLKRLQPDPWSIVETTYAEGQLVRAVVSGVVDFGAFATLDIGVEGLVHVSELSDPPPKDPRMTVQKGDELVLRILRIEPARRRIKLSLRAVSEGDRVGLLESAGTQAEEEVLSADNTVVVGDSWADDEQLLAVPAGAVREPG